MRGRDVVETSVLSKLAEAALGLVGGALAIFYLDVVTWRDVALSLVSSILLAALAPQPIAEVFGWSESSLPLLAFLCGLTGRSVALTLAKHGLMAFVRPIDVLIDPARRK